MKMNMENWWKYGKREETENTSEKVLPSATLSTTISHGLFQNRKQLSTVRGWQLKAITLPV
jgi:hypothetical protein